MKICIVSDSHDNRHLLEAAVAEAAERGAEAVLHCGDVVAPGTLEVLQKYELPVHVIHGNNTGDLYTMTRLASRNGSVIRFYGQDADIELGGLSRKINLSPEERSYVEGFLKPNPERAGELRKILEKPKKQGIASWSQQSSTNRLCSLTTSSMASFMTVS